MPARSDQPKGTVTDGADDEVARLRQRLAFVEALIAGTAEGQIAYDLGLRYTAWNPAAEALTGLTAERVLGHTPAEIYDARQAAAIERSVRRCIETGLSYAHDFPMNLEETGRHLWMTGTYRPLHDADGRIVGVIDSIRDITDRHVAVEGLRESQEQLQALFDGMADGLAILDMDGHFLEVNRAFADRLGWSRELKLVYVNHF